MTELPSFTGPPKRRASRTRRIAAAILFLCVALISVQTFLHQTSVGSPRFVEGSFILWAASVLVILALLILGTILGRNLIKLYFERKSGQVGSRFKTRMVRTFVALSLLPAVLLLLLTYWLMNFSINRWFGAPAEDMMERSRAIAQQYYEETREQSRFFAAAIAASLASDEVLRPEANGRLLQKLAEACRQYRLGSIRVFDDRSRLVAEAGQGISLSSHEEEVNALISHAGRGVIDSAVDKLNPNDPLHEVVWGVAPIRDRAGRITGRLLTEMVRPNRLQFKLDSVNEDYNAYKQLQQGKGQLRFALLFILIISTVFIVFAFSWFAMYLAKRVTVPIKALAEGAAAVAAGDLAYRVTCDAMDELGSLVSGFNRMTADLQENKNRIEAAQNSLRQTNVELDNRRRYIEAILQTIATGVISLDRHFSIRTMNPAAMQMFDVQSFEGSAPLDEVVKGPARVTLRMLLHKSTVLGPVMRNIELTSSRKTLHLATTVTPLV
ncbi:MAG TPA: HAMP domain-containing protein, partial [Spirochaetia bacterium]|nr:HAMP domain-containing protein [Spirochaetia bacterium]